ncbi:family 43 glycosylhydrolase [Micromonospora sp. AMSO12t]|uniref:family 43 glycosylhydrolase n=1 Tax=Micromonospora sp. AMSO12t TaxID=2650410 RepID=UPI00351ADE5C
MKLTRARRIGTRARHAIAVLAGLICTVALLPGTAQADNPIVQHIYTADPAPMVHNGRVYVYTGHDEDGSTYFTMREWRVFSSADMVNWTDHGVPMNLGTFAWADADAWAGHVVPRNGKFYWYVPVRQRGGGMVIGVGVADSPTGPFRDALGRRWWATVRSTRTSSSTTTGRRICTGATRTCGTCGSIPT